jgi:hypothetical protein
MSRLPTVGSDNDNWGTVLNDFLSVSLNTDGTIKSSALTSKVGQTVGSSVAVTDVWVGTQATYNGLTPNATTLYFIQ